jgi:hypothetical protein
MLATAELLLQGATAPRRHCSQAPLLPPQGALAYRSTHTRNLLYRTTTSRRHCSRPKAPQLAAALYSKAMESTTAQAHHGATAPAPRRRNVLLHSTQRRLGWRALPRALALPRNHTTAPLLPPRPQGADSSYHSEAIQSTAVPHNHTTAPLLSPQACPRRRLTCGALPPRGNRDRLPHRWPTYGTQAASTKAGASPAAPAACRPAGGPLAARLGGCRTYAVLGGCRTYAVLGRCRTYG